MQHYFTKWGGLLLFFIGSIGAVQAQYCMPTTNCNAGDGIREFGIAGFFNASACEMDDGVAGYGDFTDLTGLEVGQGVPYTVTLRSDFGNQEISIWIDADNSESFEDSELILTDEPVGTDQVTTEVVIPATIPIGQYRLRVQAAYFASSSIDPCTVGTFGETEDYTVNITAPPACLPVSAITATAVTGTTADISWTENGEATAWDIEFGIAGFIPTGIPSVGYDNITNPVTLTGLAAVTDYQVYVRADCDMDNEGVSSWTGPLSFTTLCTSFEPPYLETFAIDPADCWTEYGDGTLTTGPLAPGFSSWFPWGFANNGTFEGAQRVSLFFSGLNNWLVSPMFDLSVGGPHQVEFDFAITANGIQAATNLDTDDEVHFLISTDNGITWTEIQMWGSADNVDPTGEKIVHDLAAYQGQMVQFAFYVTTGFIDESIFSDVFVDNFYVREPPTCIEVSGVAVGSITGESATVSWTENGDATVWDIEYGLAGFTPTGLPSAGYDNITNPANLTALSPVTAYDVYVRAQCDDDTSLWIGPLSFTTACATFIPPYVQDFTLFEPECWEQADNGDWTEGPQNFGFSSWFSDGFGNDGFEGSQKINLFTLGKNDWLISPLIDLTTGGPYQVEFDVAITLFASQLPGTMGSDDAVRFLISTDNGTTWDSLDIWDNTSSIAQGGEHFIYSLDDYAGQVVQFAFWGTEGTVDDFEDIDFFVDNFFVRIPPSCPEISNLSVVGVTGGSAIIFWNENGDANVWDVEFGQAGFVPTGEPTPGYDNVGNPVFLSDLDPITTYDVYVRADCSDDEPDVAIWIGPLSFTTGCIAFTPPYLQDFTLIEPECWEQADNGDWTEGPQNFGFSSWFSDGFANIGFEGAQKINLFTLGKSDWLVSPIIDATNGGPYQVEFDVAITQFASQIPATMGSDDEVRFLISEDNGASWTTLEIWTSDSLIQEGGQHYVIDLEEYFGQELQFAFWGTEGSIDDIEDVDFFVDNFEVVDGPNALMATVEVLNINCNSDGDGRIELFVTGGDEPYQYEWSNGDVTSLIFDLPAGEYTCTVTDGFGNMVVYGPYIIGADTLETTFVVTNETVEGAADGTIDLEVEGGNGPYTYFWNIGATTQDLEGLSDGEYCVTITDVNDCEQFDCVTVMTGPTSNVNMPDLQLFNLYPNPVSGDQLQVQLAFANAKDVQLSIVNTLGQQLDQVQIDGVTDMNQVVRVVDLPKGIYFVQLLDKASKQVVSKRFVRN